MASNSSSNNSGGGSEVSRELDRAIAGLTSQLTASAVSRDGALASQLEQLRGTSQLQADASSDNTRALIENTVAHAASGAASAIKTAGSVLSTVLGSGLGLSPLIGGLVKLFGGGDSKTPPPLVSYAAPEGLKFEGQVSRQAGVTDWSRSATSRTGAPVGASGPHITVQVNAMDSKSFLDHSHEIARAVREAMLNSNAINDVVNDL